jgi:hypothetical protein
MNQKVKSNFSGDTMKRILISAAILGILSTAAHAGVFSVVKHLAGDAYHVAKYSVLGVAKAVKHAAGDAKTVAK